MGSEMCIRDRISSHLDLEPQTAGPDPEGTLLPAALELHLAADGDLPPHWAELYPSGTEAQAAVAAHLHQAEPPRGLLHWLGHAHLDLAWLWPVADTWQAAERTFRSTLALMRRWPELRFAHSTPALYAWMEQHRPALFAEIQAASRADVAPSRHKAPAWNCLLYTSPSPRDLSTSRMPSSA